MPTVIAYDEALRECTAELAQLKARGADLQVRAKAAEIGALQTARNIRAMAEGVPAAAALAATTLTPALQALDTLKQTAEQLGALFKRKT